MRGFGVSASTTRWSRWRSSRGHAKADRSPYRNCPLVGASQKQQACPVVPLTWAVMGHKEPMTIAAALRLVQKHELVIPAIQREFVWKAPQVVKVFDSIMRGYPVGSFLSWRVEPENLATFKFYGFLKDYSAFDQRHNPVVDIPNDQPRVAVLDGQQRLTSLNIGLRGSYAYKTKNAWSNKVSSYPIRRLYLNLLADASDNDAGLKYDLRFLTAEQLEDTASDPAKVWFPVSDIFEAAEPFQMMQLPVKFGVGNDAKAVEMISVLWEAVHRRTRASTSTRNPIRTSSACSTSSSA